MGKALQALWDALATIFGATNKAAQALNHLAEWSEETAASFAEEARAERLSKKKALEEASGIKI